jgi:hypothetical protein
VSKDEDPLQIALLIDNSVVMRNRVAELRRGVSAFIKALRPGVQLSLITLAERPTILAPYTTDRDVLEAAVGRLIPHDAANYVLDGIAETSQALASRRGSRSVIAAVTGRGPEYSHREYPEVLRIVRDNGTPALHVLMVGGLDVNQAIGQAQRDPRISDVHAGGPERDILLGRLTKDTGGRYEDVLSLTAIPTKMQQLASELSSQYKVVYARPQRLIPPKNTEVSARDPKLKARGMVVRDSDQ